MLLVLIFITEFSLFLDLRIIAVSLDTIILLEWGAVLRFYFLSFAFFSYMLQTTPKSLDEKNVKKGKIRAWMFIWWRYGQIVQGFQDVPQTLSGISVSVIWDSSDYVKNSV